jgi:hypothetical protein
VAPDRQDEKTFNAVVAKFPNVTELAKAVRAYVIDFMPGVYEIVWPQMRNAGYGTGPKKMSEHFVWIAPQQAYVGLGFFYGGELADPHGLLEGTGAKMRHVKIRSADDLKRPGLRALLQAASKHRVPPLRDDADADLAAARKAALAGPANKAKAVAKAKPAKAAPKSSKAKKRRAS